MAASPPVSVVVASHGRHLRLRWLLNALEEQTLEPDMWQVVVVHDYDLNLTERVLLDHPLHAAGRMRQIPIPAGTGSPARQRNLGWRAADGERVAFIDDDCRPEPGWLGALLAVSRTRDGAIVQGTTRPDPLEAAILAAPHVRTLRIDPVGPYAQTCNILYPRRLLEDLEGFDEAAVTGEDVDLSLRARARGATIVAAPTAVVNHAVESFTLPGIVAQNLKWRHLAYLVKHHPELRSDLPLRIFWDAEHMWTASALLGAALARWSPWSLLAAAPYIVRSSRRRGPSRLGRAVALAEMPGQAVRQTAEVVGLAVGSACHGTLVL